MIVTKMSFISIFIEIVNTKINKQRNFKTVEILKIEFKLFVFFKIQLILTL